MLDVFKIFNDLKRLWIAKSDNAISKMMNKSARYISWLRATNHDSDLAAMLTLYVRLDDIHQDLISSGDTAKADQVSRTADFLWSVIRLSAATRTFQRRSAEIQMKSNTKGDVL